MPKKTYKCACGLPTFNDDGICLICHVKDGDAIKVSETEKTEQPEKEETVKDSKEKKCGCGEMFKPTSNRQIRCKTCREKGKPSKKSAPTVAKKPKRKSYVPGLGVAPPAGKKIQAAKQVLARMPLDSTIGPITLDFTQYPLLYKKLIEEAEKDFRPTDLEVMYLLSNTFASMEKTLEAEADA